MKRLQQVFLFNLIWLILTAGLAHGNHESSRHHHEHHGANIIVVGDMELTLEPLLVADSTFKLALTVTDHSHYDHDHDKNITVILPDGSSVDANIHSSVTIVELDTVQVGTYRLTDTPGHDELHTSFMVMQAEGDLGTDITLVLAPRPDHHTTEVEAYVYTFEDGEAVHRAVVLELAQQSQTATYDLSHTHFSESYITEGFEPMAEQATVTFPTAGEWLVSLTIVGGLPETATFTVRVE